MKSALQSIQERLDACEKEVLELEAMNNQIKEALDTVPFMPRHRRIIEATCLQCAQEIAVLRSKVKC
jgi:prefoldin subunit 5